MKVRKDNPAPPFQLSYVRPDGTVVPNEVWVCGECRILTVGNHTKEGATQCCMTRRCACGAAIAEPYYTACKDCRDEAWNKKRSEEWLAMPVVPYPGGPVLYSERFYADMDDLLDSLADEEPEDLPEEVELCTERLIGSRLSARGLVEDILERLTEDHEDPDAVTIHGEEELEAAVKQFLSKQTYIEWFPAGKRVRVPRE
jgi:hypothetical protein